MSLISALTDRSDPAAEKTRKGKFRGCNTCVDSANLASYEF